MYGIGNVEKIEDLEYEIAVERLRCTEMLETQTDSSKVPQTLEYQNKSKSQDSHIRVILIFLTF